jgi:RNA polymerase sigma-32 factor
LSLDEPLKSDSNTERIEFINLESDSSEDQMAKKEIEDILRAKVDEFKKGLNERELEIFERRIFSDSPETLQEIGEEYTISRERVRQIENNILKKMKAFFKKDMPDFDMYDHSR